MRHRIKDSPCIEELQTGGFLNKRVSLQYKIIFALNTKHSYVCLWRFITSVPEKKKKVQEETRLNESIEYQEWNNFLCKLPNKWNQKWLRRFFFSTFSSTMCANRQQSPPCEPRSCSLQTRGTHTDQSAGNAPIQGVNTTHGKTSCRFENAPSVAPLSSFWDKISSSSIGMFSWALLFN